MKKLILLFSAALVLNACKQATEKQTTEEKTVMEKEKSAADYTRLVRENGAAFHKNFSTGDFEKNGQLVTEDIYVNSNNVILTGRDNFVQRIKRYEGPFPGMQLNDRIVIVEGNIAAVHYLLQGEQKGPYSDLAATGNKVEGMSAEFFVMDEKGLMKDLLTITQLDKLTAQIKGEETVEAHQQVTLYPIDATVPKAVTAKTADMYLRHFNFRNWEALKSLLASDVKVNWNGKMIEGADAFMEALKSRVGAFSNITYQLDRSVTEANRSAIGYTMRGNHDGLYTYKNNTYQSTKKAFEVREAQFLEVMADGKIKAVIIVSNQDEFLNFVK